MRYVGQTLGMIAFRERRRLTGLAIVPVALLIHNLEEAFTIGAALPRLQTMLSTLLGRDLVLPSAQQYRLALSILTGIGFGVLLLARIWDQAAYALVVLQAVMTLNVVSHVVGAVLLESYVPGVVTAILVEAPTSAVVFSRLRRRKWMSTAQWRSLPLLAILLHAGVLVGLLLWAHGVRR